MLRPAYIYLRDFFIQVLCCNRPELKDKAIAIYNGRQQVIQCNDVARDLGVKTAMRVKEATSFVSSLALFPLPQLQEDPLAEIGRKLLTLSPRVARFGAHDLVVETGVSDHLAGGVRPLVASVYQSVKDAGFSPYVGVATSLAEARLAACFRANRHVHVVFVAPGDDSLARSLPLEQLYSLLEFKPSSPGRRLFAYLGLKTLEDVRSHAARIRQSLLNKETAEILLYATRSLHLEKRLSFIREETRLEQTVCFSPAINRVSSLVVPLERLLGQLMEALSDQKQLATQLQLRFVTDSKQEELVAVRSAHPTRNVGLWLMLSETCLENVSLERPLEELGVEVVHCVPQVQADGELFDRGRQTEGDMQRLCAHLESMLGAGEGLFQVRPREAHLPEEQFELHVYRPSARSRPQPAASPLRPPASGLPPVLFLAPIPLEEQGGRGVPLYEFEFYDTKTHEVLRHNYMAYLRHYGPAFLIRRTGEETVIVGLQPPASSLPPPASSLPPPASSLPPPA